MLALSEKKLLDFSRQFEGTVRPVLIEHNRKGHPVNGFTDNYLKVVIPDTDASEIDNNIIPVRIIETINDGEEMKGEIVR